MKEPLLGHESSSLSEAKRSRSLFADVGLFSNITFSWMGPLLDLGKRKTLDLNDVPFLDDCDSVHGIVPKFRSKIASISATGQYTDVTTVKLAKALVLTTWKLIIVTAVYALLRTVTSYVGPYLIEYFVGYLNESPRSAKKGYLLVLAFVVAQFMESLSSRHLLFRSQQLGVRVRSALIAIIYQKGLALSSQSRQSSSNGELINVVSLDAERVGDFNWSMHELWLVPVQISLAMVILYSTLGLAAFAALAATLLTMLANIPLGKIEQNYQEKTMTAKDARMSAMSEILQNMRILKLQGWELIFLSKIKELRKVEMNWIKKYVYTSSMLISVFFGATAFVAMITFGTCMILGIPLETGKVLSALATFRQLQGPIHSLPDTISSVIQTKVSLDRICSFLCLEELASDVVTKLPSGSTDISVEVRNGHFSWDSSSQVPTLQDLNFRVQKGMRVAICGTVGSGKSSLLSCILGEIPKLSGEVRTCGRIACVSQSPWIQSGTIEENILFGTQMNRERYEKVLAACSLTNDLDILPLGDQTVIGERGINLSGGQKQRIQIARALYQDADIFLFDDPFSAVDARTGLHLFKECLLGFLASKTVIYVTHHVEFLPSADVILVLRDGKIAQSGDYTEILKSGEELMELVVSHKDALSTLDMLECPSGNFDSTYHPGGNGSTLFIAEDKKDDNNEEEGIVQNGQLVEEEEREKGRVGFIVYWKYITMAYNGALVPLILLAQIIFQVLQIGSNFWMAWAAPVSKDVDPPVSSLLMVNVYVALALVSSLCIFIRSHFLVIAGCKTATILFEKMHECIFRAPMSFFDSTPSGRILNRASTDQSTVDTRLFDLMGYLLFPAIEILGTIILMSQIAWPVFVIFIPIIVASLWYQQYYIDAARELQRLIGVCRAPVMQHFTESIAGSNIIRCFQKERQFISSIGHLMDNLSRPSLYNAAAMEWLCFRLDILSSFIFSFTLILLVSSSTALIDPKTAGLAVTYGLSLNMLQGWAIAVLCSLENQMISVERMLQYMNIPSEPPLTISKSRPNCQWPTKGEIELRNLHVRYAPQLPFVLKGLTCTLPGGKKTGIVGRTGGGKSTLIQALFRIVDPCIGQVLIDGIDICTIGLHDLRTRLSIIPQDPVMFQGTLRSNIDPLGEYSDEQIWEALDSCHLGDQVRKNELKLDSTVIESGKNWSAGQRQLVCLGRVILKRRKILVLDEATSSVDPITDNLIQKTLKHQFSECTVITIAHRITSVLDSDKVLLLDNGEIAEYDEPAKLLEDSTSLFSKLVSEYTMGSDYK
ncbi:ABC transporter C family member 3-like [Phragmites australis]|uniref:ABC transporter C family member 3-like n=1 Tax=Phragmites australis TaxID=29695 RepID=UPI002D7A3EED|nr:ABC transporter C family member 3-like [Phragmites australis]XP_062186349.1 ABC transporter C family member 3-like [Phragmites australis]XP_062186350.1 ABC transporter C family member 3-like [Phragmites australis]